MIQHYVCYGEYGDSVKSYKYILRNYTIQNPQSILDPGRSNPNKIMFTLLPISQTSLSVKGTAMALIRTSLLSRALCGKQPGPGKMYLEIAVPGVSGNRHKLTGYS